jgi:hypothetical protein
MADLIASMNANSAFTCISTSGIALFLSGQTSFQLNVTSAGPIPISGLAKPLFGQQAGSNALASILTAEENNMLAEGGVIVNRSTAAQATFPAMLPAGLAKGNPPIYRLYSTSCENNFATFWGPWRGSSAALWAESAGNLSVTPGWHRPNMTIRPRSMQLHAAGGAYFFHAKG